MYNLCRNQNLCKNQNLCIIYVEIRIYVGIRSDGKIFISQQLGLSYIFTKRQGGVIMFYQTTDFMVYTTYYLNPLLHYQYFYCIINTFIALARHL